MMIIIIIIRLRLTCALNIFSLSFYVALILSKYSYLLSIYSLSFITLLSFGCSSDMILAWRGLGASLNLFAIRGLSQMKLQSNSWFLAAWFLAVEILPWGWNILTLLNFGTSKGNVKLSPLLLVLMPIFFILLSRTNSFSCLLWFPIC